MAIGISEEEFWTMNPRRIIIHTNAYSKKVRREFETANTIAFVQGQYFMEALMSTVGNMFSGKGHKPYEYPKEPYKLGGSENSNDSGLSDTEIQKQREMFVARFKIMQQNFEINHPKGMNLEMKEEGQES